MFSNSGKIVRWDSLEPEFLDGLQRIGVNGSGVHGDSYGNLMKRYATLISRPYLFRSFYLLFRSYTNHPVITNEMYEDEYVFSPDGCRRFPKEFRDFSVEENEKTIRSILINMTYFNNEEMSDLDQYRIRIFEALIHFLQERNCRVYLYLTPSIWRSYSELRGKDEFLTESYIREYGNRNNIPVIGSFDPKRYNISVKDCYNPGHLRPEAIARIFEYHRNE